jgi:ligand-binding sensor domain-containing protein
VVAKYLKMMKYLHVFIFLGILTIGFSCSGQDKKHFKEDVVSESKIIAVGLPKLKSLNKDDNVHCSLQDKSGNIWFGTTRNGIYKYDGKTFTQFKDSGNHNLNSINHILEDKDGKIWIGTDKGAYFYDGKTFSQFQITLINDWLPTLSTSIKNDVFSIMQDKSGKLWFATRDGVYIYDGKAITKFKVTEDTSDCFYKMEYILEDKIGNIWFGGRCNSGVFRYDGKSIIKLKPNGDNWAWPVLQDKNGNIWFSNWKGAYRFDGKSFITFTKKDGLAGDMVARIIEDKKGNIWFGGDGLSRYDGKSFTTFTANDGLLNNSIWSILEDKTGNFWVGTRETGLFLYDGKTFIKFSE